ncbi:MAG: hypothetical protein ACYTGS_21755, partial [Planctomycetota bacterium]
MSQKQSQTNKVNEVSRRRFMRDGAAAAAGVAVGLGTARGETACCAAKKKTRSYNSEMEYRRLGKTNLWVSAVCLGGHWKRV